MGIADTRLRIASIAAAAVLGLVELAGPRSAAALPDLLPEIYDLAVAVRDVLQGDVDEGCAGGRYDRRLVRFSLRTHNLGPDDLVLGSPGCPNCSLNPGAPCTNPLFHCGTAHGHAHFEVFAKNEILDGDDNVVVEGQKYGFCLLDQGSCPTPQFSCSYQGITAGCSDVYAAGLPCQYVDITDAGLSDGDYRLRVTLDPDNHFAESNEANNVIEVPFAIGATPRVCPVYPAADLPQVIPDNDAMTSVVSVPDVGPVESLRLLMSGTHTYLGDLAATLTSPAATTRTLFSQMCGSSDDFGLYLGDEALGPLVCPATDASVLRMPVQSFAPYVGEDAGGDWTLSVSDLAPSNTGTLDAWSLEVCSLCGNGTVDPGEACDDGNVSAGDCCSPDCTVAALEGAACEDGNLCTGAETCVAGSCVPGGDVECDACLVCEPSEGCVVPDLTYPCQEPPTGGSLLRLRHDAANPGRDQARWKWRSETPVELDEFGAPDLVTDISLCIYEAGSLVLSSTIPAAQTCDGGLPCWVRREHDAAFSDKQSRFEGMTRIRIREGARGKIVLSGRGSGLELGDLDLSLPTTVRMRRRDGTPCWEANYDAALLNSSGVFKARSR